MRTIMRFEGSAAGAGRGGKPGRDRPRGRPRRGRYRCCTYVVISMQVTTTSKVGVSQRMTNLLTVGCEGARSHPMGSTRSNQAGAAGRQGRRREPPAVGAEQPGLRGGRVGSSRHRPAVQGRRRYALGRSTRVRVCGFHRSHQATRSQRASGPFQDENPPLIATAPSRVEFSPPGEVNPTLAIGAGLECRVFATRRREPDTRGRRRARMSSFRHQAG